MDHGVSITPAEFQGLPVLRIRTAFGTAALSLHGGQLLSFVVDGFDDLLWLSPTSKRAPDPIRGGVPVCWPYFGRQGQAADVAQHGHARTTQWEVTTADFNAQGEALVGLALPLQADGLQLSQTLRLGAELHQSLSTHNQGTGSMSFTQALHTYLRVGDVSQVRVSGLAGLAYADKYDGREHVQDGDWDLQDPRDPGRSDRLYHRAGGDYLLSDPQLRRQIRLRTTGSGSLVVWNPGAAGVLGFSDVPAPCWREFVCLEAANAGEEVITLAAGQVHTLEQTLSVLR